MKKTLLASMAVLILSSTFAPSLVLAKNKIGEKEREKVEVKMEKKEKKIEKADGRAEKKIEKSKVKYNDYCWDQFFHRNLPFGIWKKWFDWNDSADCLIIKKPRATTTPDTTAPTISNIMWRTTTDRAFISWQTNEKASGKIYWSTTTPVNVSNASTKSSFEIGKGKNHYLALGGLSSSTNYYAIIVAKDSVGNTSTSTETNFRTKGGVVTPDTTVPTISSINTSVGSTTIGVSWQTSELATSRVYYGTSSPIVATTSTNFVSNATLKTNHLLSIDGLATSTLYHMLIVSDDGVGNTATSTQFSTTTLSGL